MSSIGRIVGGSAANGLNFLYLMTVSLATPPALIAAWGASGYGQWLMLTTIPAYLSLSDLGFTTAGRNTMAMALARGEREYGVQIFQSLIALHLIAFGAIAVVTALFIGIAYTTSLSSFISGYWAVIALLSVYACLVMFARVMLSALLATGHYVKGTLYYDAGQFIAGVAVLPVAMAGGGFVECVIVWNICWVVITAGLWKSVNTTVSWLPVGIGEAKRSILRDLLRPAVASLAIPGAIALNQQGVALVVGFALAPAATATLTVVRTATRLAVQAISVVNRATIMELSAAGARQDSDAVARVLWINVLAGAVLMVPLAMAFVAFGPELVGVWTGGAIVPGREFVALMTLGMMLHAGWYFGTSLLTATNAHVSMVAVLMVASVALVALSLPMAHYFGLSGVAVVAAVAEGVCLLRFLFAGRAAGMTLPLAVLVDMARALVGPRRRS